MHYYHSTEPFKLNHTAVACGKFDGIHKGHQALLNRLLEYKASGLEAAVFTFDPSIARVMKTEDGFIYTSEERRYILEQMGIDDLAEYAFDQTLSSMQPEQFIKKILVEQLGAKAVVVGEDFHFGFQRSGNVEMLKHYAPEYGYELCVVEKQNDKDGRISSSRIRQALKLGQMEQAAQMLGRPYFVKGTVVHGRQLGRTIGMPTANVAVPDYKLIPPCGVYVSRNWINEKKYYGITNIGNNPTVSGNEVRVETYLFSFDEDIYGEELRVEFLHYKRPEQKFNSVQELAAQMQEDAEYGKRMVGMC